LNAHNKAVRRSERWMRTTSLSQIALVTATSGWAELLASWSSVNSARSRALDHKAETTDDIV
jgi:hypothetical protein